MWRRLRVHTLPKALVIFMNAIAATYAALTGLWLILRRLTGDRPWRLQLVNEFTPIMLAPSTLVLLISAFRRSAFGIVSALVPAGVFVGLYFRRFSAQTDVRFEPCALRLMTLNLLCRNRPAVKTVDAIRDMDPDIVLLQEVLPSMAAELERELATAYPHKAVYPATRARGTAVFSKLPFRHETMFQLSSKGWYCQDVRLPWQGRDLAIFNVHLMSPLIGKAKLWQRLYNSDTRSAEMQRLIQCVREASDCDVLLAGDFNMTDQCEEYRAIRGHMNDAWVDAGRGLGFTFPARTPHGKYWYERHGPPMLHIDHVFYQGRIRPTSALVGPNGDSDHYSLVVDFAALIDERAGGKRADRVRVSGETPR